MRNQDVSLAPVIKELERAYARLIPYVMARGFGANAQDVPSPVIAVLPRGKRRTMQWYTPTIWESTASNVADALAGAGKHTKKKEHERFGEIALAGELFTENVTDHEILTALLHATVVHACVVKGGTAPVNGNGRHSARFARIAQRVGMSVKHDDDGGLGFALTSVPTTGKLADKFNAVALRMAEFDLARQGRTFGPSIQKNRKWSCGCTNVRCAVALDATCGSCGKKFKLAQ